jgi:hypothetical protein
MSTSNSSPKKKAQKAAAKPKSAAPKKSTQASDSAKKKPGRPKKQNPSPQVKFKENAKDGDGDGFVQDGTKYERPVGAPANVQKIATTIPSSSSTSSATGATPKIAINTSWAQKEKKGIFSRIFRPFRRKK